MAPERRKLSEASKRAKAAYDKKYMKNNVKQRTIGFNIGDPEDMAMYNWIGQQVNGTKYIKDLVREDMRKAGK